MEEKVLLQGNSAFVFEADIEAVIEGGRVIEADAVCADEGGCGELCLGEKHLASCSSADEPSAFTIPPMR